MAMPHGSDVPRRLRHGRPARRRGHALRADGLHPPRRAGRRRGRPEPSGPAGRPRGHRAPPAPRSTPTRHELTAAEHGRGGPGPRGDADLPGGPTGPGLAGPAAGAQRAGRPAAALRGPPGAAAVRQPPSGVSRPRPRAALPRPTGDAGRAAVQSGPRRPPPPASRAASTPPPAAPRHRHRLLALHRRGRGQERRPHRQGGPRLAADGDRRRRTPRPRRGDGHRLQPRPPGRRDPVGQRRTRRRSPPAPTAARRSTSPASATSTPTATRPRRTPTTAKNAIDGDPGTSWTTLTYRGNPALGGLKPGVGLMLDLGKDQKASLADGARSRARPPPSRCTPLRPA